ncbi:unnamed protein product [Cyprideis torosa]|uniref:Fzo/mitofusin HR2 domain-containing protein n=1 Tax=Cyprideis torosa TaxID=163714 RepID=A0A7R8ZNA1_9CRUS|nr:unnamed protein product [Cyprideis torosa]CAG0895749.1 unnamed protein product [Cyprideis torosa]
MKDKICHLVEDVERKVSIALNEEIRKLSDLVDEFSAPFHPEPIVLNVYKRELHVHVESGLGSNLKSRLSSALAVNVESAQREMAERMSQLLPTDKREIKSVLAPRREPFEMFYRLNCDNLCADFKEDISFRFSFGFTSLIQRFLGKERSKKLTMFGFSEPVPRPLSLGHMQEDDDVDRRSVRSPVSLSEEDWSLLSRFALSQVASSSQGTVGGALIAGMAFRFVGWRVLAVVGGVYAALYCYERLTYTNAAKERRFKKQYVNHASKKLRLIVDLTSANCSHQVQQELSTTFARLCTMIDDCTSEMRGEIRGLDEEAALFEDVARRAKVLKNKGVYLSGEVGQFEEKYLKD